jgi:transcription elongation GreA/GreB family factor
MTTTTSSAAADKTQLVELLSARLREDLASVKQAQNATQAGATHSESRAEGSKDTRATESSYLARGLAERVEELENQLDKLGAMPTRALPEGAAIAVGALVTLEAEDGAESVYLLAAAGGGESLDFRGATVRALTAQSPLGRLLIGRSEGDEIVVERPRGSYDASITRVR